MRGPLSEKAGWRAVTAESALAAANLAALHMANKATGALMAPASALG